MPEAFDILAVRIDFMNVVRGALGESLETAVLMCSA
jgi:hypothetical protein